MSLLGFDAIGMRALGQLSGQLTYVLSASTGSFSVAGNADAFQIVENIQGGTFTLNGNPVNEIILEADTAGAFVVTGYDASLSRTGDDYEFKLGGIGHFLEEIERAKQLAAITRKIPPPVDRRTLPRFEPIPGVQQAPSAPVVDMGAIEQQRQSEAARAATMRRRRDEEAILLLAS